MSPSEKVNGGLETIGKAGRLLTPAGILACATLLFTAGGTLDGIKNTAEQNCQNTARVANALHEEHLRARGQLHRFAPLFPRERC